MPRCEWPAQVAGDPAGPLAVHFHGAPGAPSELAVFDAPARACGLNLVCWNRFAWDAALTGPAYWEALAQGVRAEAGPRPVHLIGFSIGAFVALRVAALLGTQVAHVHLVSAAGPLQAGPFLPQMAGGPVFKAAAASPERLRAVVQAQAVLLRWAPRVMHAVLFRGARGQERELASGVAFRLWMHDVLRASLLVHRAGYERDLRAYVQDWSAVPAQVTSAATLWHGTLDTWAPVDMALCLQRSLPAGSRRQLLKGLSHFSCLHHAAPLICQQISRLQPPGAPAPAGT